MSVNELLRDGTPLLPTIADVLGRPVSQSTAYRWKDGITAPDGSLVKIQTARVGRRIVTTHQHVREFFEKLSQETPGAGSR